MQYPKVYLYGVARSKVFSFFLFLQNLPVRFYRKLQAKKEVQGREGIGSLGYTMMSHENKKKSHRSLETAALKGGEK